MAEKILLVRPPVYEIIPDLPKNSGFSKKSLIKYLEFCIQPDILLRISSYLKSLGHKTYIIDCLAELPKEHKNSVHNRTLMGYRKCGNFKNEKISFPLYHVGMSYKDFEDELEKYKDVDEVWVTCALTFHWEPAHKLIEIIKRKIPNAWVKFGGIYPTLCPEHAKKSKADEVFIGEFAEANNMPLDLDILGYQPDYVIIKTSRGCPNRCSYCARHILEGTKIRFRIPEEIINEIEMYFRKYKIKLFYFYESNPFIDIKNHFEKILDLIIKKKLDIKIMIPAGVNPNHITPEVAKKMKLAGLQSPRLSLESIDAKICLERFHRKSNYQHVVNAVNYLTDAGYKPEEIWIFILAGMPNQHLESIIQSMVKVWELGCKVRVNMFSPIPGTEEYKNYSNLIKSKGLEELHPLLFPFANEEVNVNDLLKIFTFNFIDLPYFEFLDGLLNNSKVKELLTKQIKWSSIKINGKYKLVPKNYKLLLKK